MLNGCRFARLNSSLQCTNIPASGSLSQVEEPSAGTLTTQVGHGYLLVDLSMAGTCDAFLPFPSGPAPQSDPLLVLM